jgi:hypothetical protein
MVLNVAAHHPGHCGDGCWFAGITPLGQRQRPPADQAAQVPLFKALDGEKAAHRREYVSILSQPAMHSWALRCIFKMPIKKDASIIILIAIEPLENPGEAFPDNRFWPPRAG